MIKDYLLTYDDIKEIFALWQNDYVNDDAESKRERVDLLENERFPEYSANYFIQLANLVKAAKEND